MTTRTIDIPEELARFIHAIVAEGRYHTENEVVLAALQLLEREESDYQENLEQLRVEVQKGKDAIDEGNYIELNSSEEKVSNQWPDGYFETVFGGWQGEPLERPEQGEFEQRESFN